MVVDFITKAILAVACREGLVEIKEFQKCANPMYYWVQSAVALVLITVGVITTLWATVTVVKLHRRAYANYNNIHKSDADDASPAAGHADDGMRRRSASVMNHGAICYAANHGSVYGACTFASRPQWSEDDVHNIRRMMGT